MQTFLPYPSFARSAAVLDTQRLGKQIIECRQIGLAITRPDYGWQNHPAVNMWRGHVWALMKYAKLLNDEWVVRRGRSHLAFVNMLDDHNLRTNGVLPDWFGDPEFHRAHRSNLLRKDPEHYGQFGWDEPDDLPYVWPVRKENCNGTTVRPSREG